MTTNETAPVLPAAVEELLDALDEASRAVERWQYSDEPGWRERLREAKQEREQARAAIAAALAAKDEERKSAVAAEYAKMRLVLREDPDRAVFRVESFQRERAAREAAEARVRELEAAVWRVMNVPMTAADGRAVLDALRPVLPVADQTTARNLQEPR